ncbi:hypothetical protein Ancab_034621 [Ancistrocladus abbreviatus]
MQVGNQQPASQRAKPPHNKQSQPLVQSVNTLACGQPSAQLAQKNGPSSRVLLDSGKKNGVEKDLPLNITPIPREQDKGRPSLLPGFPIEHGKQIREKQLLCKQQAEHQCSKQDSLQGNILHDVLQLEKQNHSSSAQLPASRRNFVRTSAASHPLQKSISSCSINQNQRSSVQLSGQSISNFESQQLTYQQSGLHLADVTHELPTASEHSSESFCDEHNRLHDSQEQQLTDHQKKTEVQSQEDDVDHDVRHLLQSSGAAGRTEDSSVSSLPQGQQSNPLLLEQHRFMSQLQQQSSMSQKMLNSEEIFQQQNLIRSQKQLLLESGSVTLMLSKTYPGQNGKFSLCGYQVLICNNPGSFFYTHLGLPIGSMQHHMLCSEVDQGHASAFSSSSTHVVKGPTWTHLGSMQRPMTFVMLLPNSQACSVAKMTSLRNNCKLLLGEVYEKLKQDELLPEQLNGDHLGDLRVLRVELSKLIELADLQMNEIVPAHMTTLLRQQSLSLQTDTLHQLDEVNNEKRKPVVLQQDSMEEQVVDHFDEFSFGSEAFGSLTELSCDAFLQSPECCSPQNEMQSSLSSVIVTGTNMQITSSPMLISSSELKDP